MSVEEFEITDDSKLSSVIAAGILGRQCVPFDEYMIGGRDDNDSEYTISPEGVVHLLASFHNKSFLPFKNEDDCMMAWDTFARTTPLILENQNGRWYAIMVNRFSCGDADRKRAMCGCMARAGQEIIEEGV